jgi:hypothetical protein
VETSVVKPDWRLAATWSVSGLMLAAMAVFVTARAWLPGDRAVLQIAYRFGPQPWVVAARGATQGGLETGDIVLGLEGRATDEWLRGSLTHPLSPPAHNPETLRYTVRRGQALLTVEEPQVRGAMLDNLRANWSYFVFMSLLQVTGVLLVLRRPKLPAARALLLLASAITSSSAVYFLSLRPSDMRYGWMLLLYLACSVLLFGLLAAGAVHFTLTFPRVQPILRQRPWLLPALYLGAWAPFALTLALRWRDAPDLAARGQLLLAATNSITVVCFPVAALVCLWIYARIRSASERRQLRWVAWGVAGGVFPWILMVIVPAQFGLPVLMPPAVVGLTWCLIPVTIAIAILREGLFDIDVIINRTLVYGALSGLLVAAYFGSVVVFQEALRLATGETGSALATVLSTLAIAALFSPLRTQVQQAIDRRFYRRKYDAARTLAAFGATLRDDVDLETLERRLLAVVAETMEPRHVGLWLASSRPAMRAGARSGPQAPTT